MFRSVFRPSSGVRFCALRNYYVSACLLCLVPICGGMLSVIYINIYIMVYDMWWCGILAIIQDNIQLTCLCIYALYLSVWCLDVYCRLCSVAVARVRRVRNKAKQAGWHVVIMQGTETDPWWWSEDWPKHVGFFVKLILSTQHRHFNVCSFKCELWKCF